MKMNRQNLCGLLLTLVTLTASGQDSAYEQGQQALRVNNWSAAVELFSAAEGDRERADAALYWRAYALSQMGRKKEASGVARQVLRRFEDSPWADDASALLDELGQPPGGPQHDDELSVFALTRLMHKNPERTLPLIADLLDNNPSPETQRQLLFILASSESDEGNRLVLELAMQSQEPELQMQAIHMVAAGTHGEVLPQLANIYRASHVPEVKRAIIDAHMMADEPGQLPELIRTETDPELQRHAIITLGAMGQAQLLNSIYGDISGSRERAAVLEAMAISGDVSQLAGVIESETDPELRLTAIRSLGIADDGNSDELLSRLAASATTEEELMAILEGVIIMDSGSETVLAVARRASSPEVQRQAIQTLAILDESDALMDLYEELKGRTPEVDRAMLEALLILDDGAEIAYDIARTSSSEVTVAAALEALGVLDESDQIASLYPSLGTPYLKRIALQHMTMTDDSEGLLGILRNEQSPELRVEAIRALTIMDVSDDDTLLEIYRKGTTEEKLAITEIWMIQESDEAVVRALENETDSQLRRRLVEVLVVMDSDAADEYLYQWLKKERM